ncbi:MAG: DUF1624 domain-containing protein [Elusimicrobia bacterium]|nr:DUF1624 domain-containing protein [Elusimicrobiota bacterium]
MIASKTTAAGQAVRAPSPAKRLDSVDVMRAAAIIFMVLCHFPIFLSPLVEVHKWLYFFSNHVVGDFAAPFFLFLVGFSQAISLGRQAVAPAAAIWNDRAVRRGLFVFVIGLGFSLIVRGPADIVEWDILTLIGSMIILLRFLRCFNQTVLIVTGIAIVAIAPFLRSFVDYFAFWGGGYYSVPGISDWAPGLLADPNGEYLLGRNVLEIVQGYFLIGYFPVFPWAAFAVFGFAVGKRFLIDKKPTDWRVIFGAGALSALMGLAGAFWSTQTGETDPSRFFISALSFYPLSVTMFLVQIGAGLMFFAAGRRLFDVVVIESWWMVYLRRLSRYSLTVYVLHHIVIYWPMHIAGWISGGFEKYYANAMSTPLAFGLAILFLLLMGPLMARWDSAGSRYSFEWILAKAVK